MTDESTSLEETARELYPTTYHGDPRDEAVHDGSVKRTGLTMETALERWHEGHEDQDDTGEDLPEAAQATEPDETTDDLTGPDAIWTNEELQEWTNWQHHGAQFQHDLQVFTQAKQTDTSEMDKGQAAALRAQLQETEKELRQRYEALQSTAMELQSRAQARQAERFKQAIERERKKMEKAMPDLDKTALRDYLKTQGFSEQELEYSYDARLVILAEKARQLDNLAGKDHQARKIPTKSGGKRNRGGETKVAKLDARFRKTGRIDDALALLTEKKRRQTA